MSEIEELRAPDVAKYIPLWEVNHSRERLIKEQKRDNTAYLLGYEMQEESDDPALKAYKRFSHEYAPHGNVIPVGHNLDFDASYETWMVADFNVGAMSWALMQVRGNVYVVFDELFSKNILTEDQAKKMADKLNDWGIRSVILAGDNTSNQRSGRYGRYGRNDWDYVRNIFTDKGIRWKSRLKVSNPKRKIRTDLVNKIIHNGEDSEGKRIQRLFVVDRCKFVIKDYRYSITDEDGQKIDNGDRGHMSDAVDYGIYANEGGGTAIYSSIPLR